MLLQLVGCLEAGETYARVNLEAADLVPHSAPPSNDYVELELVNIIICQNAAHNHFEPFPPTAEYPRSDTDYQEKITIKVPRPQPLVHRRRTRYFTFPEDAPPSVAVKRSKRTLPRGIGSLGDYQVEYKARFNSPLHTFDVTPLNILSPAGLVKKLQEQARPRIERHFQRLLADLPSYELDTTGSTRRSSYKIKITLPPQTRQFCSHKEIFTILGFENQISEEDTGVEITSTKWALVNNSTTEKKVFLSEHFVDTATLINVLLVSKKISFQAETIYFYFGRYPTMFPPTYLNFTEEALCSKNPAATSYFFQLLLECIVDQLGLPAQSLRVTLNDKQLLFSKDPRLEKTEDHTNNFNFYARFGPKIEEKLGLSSPGVIWRLNGGRKLELVQLQENLPDETEEESRLCQTVMSTFMREQFYNQEGGNANVVGRWQQQWQEILTQRQAAERKRVADAAAERKRVADAAAATAKAAEERKRLVEAEAAAAAERKRVADAAAAKAAEERKRLVEAEAAAAAERKRLAETKTSSVSSETPPPAREEEVSTETPPAQEEEKVSTDTPPAQEEEASTDTPPTQEEASTDTPPAQEEESSTDAPPAQEEASTNTPPAQEEEASTDAPPAQEEEEVSTDAPPVQEEASTDAPPAQEDVPSDTPPAVEAETAEEHGEDVPVIEEEEENDETDDDSEEVEDPWMEIEIDNPEPRPPANFLVANATRPHICTPPHEFPKYCTVVVKEGEPTDYVATRGLCSILGLIRDKQPNVVSNKCIVKNIKNMKYLSIEFIDQALNTYKIQPNNTPMWIKIDLRASRNVYY